MIVREERGQEEGRRWKHERDNGVEVRNDFSSQLRRVGLFLIG